MPFEPGNRLNPGGSPGIGRRKLQRAINDALDAENNKNKKNIDGESVVTFQSIANELIWTAMQREDLTAKLRAIGEIANRTDGRPMIQKDEDIERLGRTIATTFFEMNAEKIEQTDDHIEKMRERVSNGSGGGGTHSLPVATMSNDV